MQYIGEQAFCDLLKISKGHLRKLLRNREYPVYEVKRNGRRVYCKKDAADFVKIINIERQERRKQMSISKSRK